MWARYVRCTLIDWRWLQGVGATFDITSLSRPLSLTGPKGPWPLWSGTESDRPISNPTFRVEFENVTLRDHNQPSSRSKLNSKRCLSLCRSKQGKKNWALEGCNISSIWNGAKEMGGQCSQRCCLGRPRWMQGVGASF